MIRPGSAAPVLRCCGSRHAVGIRGCRSCARVSSPPTSHGRARRYGRNRPRGRPPTKPCRDCVARPPMTPGTAIPSSTSGEVPGVDLHHPTIRQPVTGVSAPIDLLHANSQPTCPCHKPFARPRDARTLRLRRMWIAIGVGECVVQSMICHPEDHRALGGHRTRDTEEHLYRFGRLERAVREIAMQARLHAQRGDQVHDDEQHDVGDHKTVVERVQRSAPTVPTVGNPTVRYARREARTSRSGSLCASLLGALTLGNRGFGTHARHLCITGAIELKRDATRSPGTSAWPPAGGPFRWWSSESFAWDIGGHEG